MPNSMSGSTTRARSASTWSTSWWSGTKVHPGPIEHRLARRHAGLSVILNPNGGVSEWVPAPEFSPQMHYIHTGAHRPIKLYHSIDVRWILEDFFAKLARFNRGEREFATFG